MTQEKGIESNPWHINEGERRILPPIRHHTINFADFIKGGTLTPTELHQEALLENLWEQWRTLKPDSFTGEMAVFTFDLEEARHIPTTTITDVLLPVISIFRYDNKNSFVSLSNMNEVNSRRVNGCLQDETRKPTVLVASDTNREYSLLGDEAMRDKFEWTWHQIYDEKDWVKGAPFLEHFLPRERIEFLREMTNAGLLIKSRVSNRPYFKSIV